MLKKMITYEGLDGQEVTEEFWFHLSKADLIELELNTPGGMGAMIERVVESNDNRQIYNEFKKIIMASYGVKSEDGRRFVKNDAVRSDFEGSEAYSALVVELLGDENAATQFVNGLLPKDMSFGPTAEVDQTYPRPVASLADEPERKVLTPREIEEMSAEELKSGLATGKYIIG